MLVVARSVRVASRFVSVFESSGECCWVCLSKFDSLGFVCLVKEVLYSFCLFFVLVMFGK